MSPKTKAEEKADAKVKADIKADAKVVADKKKSDGKVEAKTSDSKKIKELEDRVKELETVQDTNIPPKPKRVLNSAGDPVIHENAEVVKILEAGPKSLNHKHCSMSDGTTKNVPSHLFE